MSNVRKQNPRNFLEVLRSKAGNTAVESADEPSLFLLPEARDSSTVTLIRAADSRNARHPRFLLLPLLSSLSRAGDDSPRSGFRALALRGTTCSSAGSSWAKPPPLLPSSPSKPSGNRVFLPSMIKAAAFHVTSYLDLWRLFLASRRPPRENGTSRGFYRSIPRMDDHLERYTFSPATLGFPVFRLWEIGLSTAI